MAFFFAVSRKSISFLLYLYYMQSIDYACKASYYQIYMSHDLYVQLFCLLRFEILLVVFCNIT